MIRVMKSAVIKAPAQNVWKTIRDFNGLPKFVAMIKQSKMEGAGVGAVRTLTMADGHRAVETLQELDDDAMKLRYSLEDAPRPFQGYSAVMRLKPLEDGSCRLEWSSTFEAAEGVSEEDARSGPEGLYEAGFKGLKKLHEG